MPASLVTVVDLERYPLSEAAFMQQCRAKIDRDGVLVLEQFMQAAALQKVYGEGVAKQHLAYFKTQQHTVYLSPPDDQFASNHARNRMVESSKGCITDDQIDAESPLRLLYDDAVFQQFLCAVLQEAELHPYADSLSSINLHYAQRGQELGWHFDNSSFAVTLMVQAAVAGGVYESLPHARNSANDDMGFETVDALLNGDAKVLSAVQRLQLNAGDLVLFRGRDALHRVTPNEDDPTRMLAVLAYNNTAGVALSESARLTFYGRLV